MESRSVQFASAARSLGEAARHAGFAVPAFRSPPRIAGRVRSIRRHANGSVTISLVVKNRPWSAVVADMIDGFAAANNEVGQQSLEVLRDMLWAAVEQLDVPNAPAAATTRLHVVDAA